MPQVTEIRPGTGVFNDMNTVQGDFCSLANCAGAIVCTVANNEVWGQVVLDAGAKTLTIDRSGNTAVSPLARGINAASNLLYTQSAMLLLQSHSRPSVPGGDVLSHRLYPRVTVFRTHCMVTADQQPRTALTYEVHARADGKVEFVGPFQPGEWLTVIVIPEAGRAFDDLVAAAGSTLDFCDNPLDDEDWNAAPAA